MILLHLLVAVFWVSLTCTVISVDGGLVRTSTSCTSLSSSLTLYVDWLNVTVVAKQGRLINVLLRLVAKKAKTSHVHT